MSNDFLERRSAKVNILDVTLAEMINGRILM